jgi:hypothetical protein
LASRWGEMSSRERQRVVVGGIAGGVGSIVGGGLMIGALRRLPPPVRALPPRAVAQSQEALARARAAAKDVSVTKAVASDGVQTVSGWTGSPGGFARVTPEEVASYSKKIGHELTPVGGPDQVSRGGFPGKFNASHAEKQLAVARPNDPIAVSRPMCSDCQGFFRAQAEYTGKPQVVTDPDMTRVFQPDGTVTEILE